MARTETTKYLIFYKDAVDAENKYLEEHKGEDYEYLLKKYFDIEEKWKYRYEIIDMCMKFDENDNPFTLIAYLDCGVIQYTKFDEKIHKIEY